MSEPVRAMLTGGDRRSTGRADELAEEVLQNRIAIAAVYPAMFDEDEAVRMRAADALEKISVQRPEWLQPYKQDLLERLPDMVQPEVRWHVAQMLPRLALTPEERDARVLPVLLDYLRDKSRIVQTFALQALTDFAASDRRLRPQVLTLVEAAARTGSAAVRARCRQLLRQLSPPPDLRP